MTATKRKYLVRRLGASAVVAVLLAVGLARAFAGGSSPAPPDSAAALVPSDALIYLNLGTAEGSPQWKHTAQAMSRLPLAGQLRQALFAATSGGALGKLTLERDVEPWLGNEAAYAQLPGRSQNLLVLRVRSQRAALKAIERAGGSAGSYRGTALHDIGDGSVAAFANSWVLMGASDAVRKGLDARARPASSLGKSATYNDLVGGLPSDRVANAWLSQTWLSSHFAGPAAILAGAAHVSTLEAAAVGFGDDGKVMRLALRARPVPGPSTAPGCNAASGQSDDLLSKAPAQPALFVGLAGAECALRDLIASPGSSIGGALRSFSTSAQRAGVNVDRQLLPLLRGDSALSLTPGPTITLDAGHVPAQQSLNTIGALVPLLVRKLNPEAGGMTPNYTAQRRNGVSAVSASLTPGLELSYAAYGGDLVLSNSVRAIGSPKNAQHLDQSRDFKLVLGTRPASPSALVFLDLEKLLAFADQAGLGSNPTYAAVRDDLQKIGAAGAVLSREGNDIDAELRLKNP